MTRQHLSLLEYTFPGNRLDMRRTPKERSRRSRRKEELIDIDIDIARGIQFPYLPHFMARILPGR
jgi:hypothetical protein